MKTSSLLSRLALGSLLTSLLIGCPTVPEPDPLPPPPSVLSFTASASLVPVGTTVKLSWATQNATEVSIDELKLGSVSGVSGTSGEIDVGITGDSLFVITARNARGASDTAVVSVRVGTGEGALLFSALPDSISVGQSVTLAWSARGASAVTITASPGGAVELAGQSTSGSVVVWPTTNTTYTLTAGARVATTEVTVLPSLLSFQASPLAADAGSTVTLSWTTANATRVTLTAPGRATLVDETDPARVASGSFDDVLPAQVDPGQLFPYQLTVTGPGATLTDSVVVSIAGSPAVLTLVGPKYASQTNDAGVPLSWTTRDADAVELTADGVTIYRAPAGSIVAGSVRLPTPAIDTTYALTATSARGGSASKTLAVDVVGPPTVTLTATPSSVAAGAPVVLSWAGRDIRNVRISTATSGNLFTATATTDTGAASPQGFIRDELVRIDVDNGAGETAFATAPVTVTGGLQFSVPAGAARAGEKVTLSWTPATFAISGLAHDEVIARPGSTGFDDISGTGTAVSFADNDAAARFQPVGFSAPFFDRVVGSEVWMDADGYLSFSPVGNWNFSSVALPSSKIEPYSIAACWADVTTTPTGRWQVKDITGGKVLIVQWDSKFQIKVFSSGQVDIEYKAPGTCTNRGVRGPSGDMGFPFAPAPVADLGLTLFGPKTGSALIPVTHEVPAFGRVELAGSWALVRAELGQVIRPNELSVSEALPLPAASVGPAGQWFELFNARSTAIDLTGWSLGVTDGGIAGVLSGTIPPRGVLLVGASADRALNDDAGVQLELAGFSPGLDAGTVALQRNGTLSTFSWADAGPGVSIVSDFGPFRFSTDTSSSLARAQECTSTSTFGGQLPLQAGSPGAALGCGFPYVWEELRGGFFDISTTGTMGVITDPAYDEATFSLPLTGAPFTYFGTQQTSANVSTNGFISFDGTSRNSTLSGTFPVATDVNAVLAPFGGDLVGYWANSEIYSQRIGANVDPAAAAPHWIIQWKHWSHSSTSTDTFTDYGDDLNFQIKLFDDGVIEYHYGRMVSASSTRSAAGIRTNTWLENPTGTQALVINTKSYTPGISPNSGYRFIPR